MIGVQGQWHILRSASASLFQLKQLRFTFKSGIRFERCLWNRRLEYTMVWKFGVKDIYFFTFLPFVLTNAASTLFKMQ